MVRGSRSRTEYVLIHKSKVNLLLYPIKGLKGTLVFTDPSLPTDDLVGIRNTIARYEKS